MKLPLHTEIMKTLINPMENPTQLLIKFNSLISKLTRSNQFSQALHLFDKIHSSHHLKPDHYSFASTLTACANRRDTITGSQLHSLLIRTGYKSYQHVDNSLLSFYAKSNDLNSVDKLFDEIITPDVYSWTTILSAHARAGQIDYALKLFDEMPQRNVAVWNAVITGCIENRRQNVALHMFLQMHELGIGHDHYTFASLLSLCSSPSLLDFGKQVHSLVIRTGFLVRVSVINATLTMYLNCGLVSDAYELYQESKYVVCNEITFNAMIAGLVSLGRDVEALMIFKEMQEAYFEPTELTFVSILSSCSSLQILILGKQVHGQVIKIGFENFTLVGNATMAMYSNCANGDAAFMVFETLEEKDLVSWNSMIACYAQGNYCYSALMAYSRMQIEGIKSDDFTVGSLLSCSELGVTEIIQALVTKNGLIFNVEVGNALVCAYSKHGEIDHAYRIFSNMSSKNLISWNSIISGCLLNQLFVQSLNLLCEMQMSGLKPNLYTFSILLNTCASISALRTGKEVHAYILRSGYTSEISLGNGLLTLYAKCGFLDLASKVFYGMTERDTVSWNSMIAAYAQHGEGKDAMKCFEAMLESGYVKPDKATFTVVLSACNHAGLVVEGRELLSSMVEDYGTYPEMDQYCCVIDLLGRAGFLEEAERLISEMPFQPDSTIWWALLSACTTYGNVRLGRIAADVILETEPDNSAVYVLLSNLYVATGQHDEAARMREAMAKKGVKKQPGYSWT